SRGFYNYQPVRKNSGSLFGNYLGEEYSLYTSIHVNKHEIAENGGIIDVDSLLDGDQSTGDMATQIPGADGANALTPNAKNTLKSRNIFLMQKYRLHQDEIQNDSVIQDQAFFNLEFAHLFKYDVFAKYYEDELDSEFYNNRFLNSANTRDSLIYKKLSNTARIEFNEAQKYNVAVRADLTHEISHFRHFLINDTANKYQNLGQYTFLDNVSDEDYTEYMNFAFMYDVNKKHFDYDHRITNLFASAALYNKIPRKWDWIINGDYYLAGYNFGDFNLYGEVDRTFGKDSLISLSLSGNYKLKTPSPIYSNFYSNHFKWTDLSFPKVNIFTLSGKLGLPKYNAYVKYTQSNLYNYIYLNENVQPEQIGRLVSINALEISHEMDKGIFRTQEYVVLQQSSDEGIIDLPLVSLKAKIYVVFPMLFKSTGGRLDHIIGLSVRYNTEYYADAYMPAIMSYYKQRNTKVGNYPYVNAFWNIKLKQVRFLLKYEHVNYGLMARNITLVPDYPQSPGVFKVGVAWTFYN
ncbi:MAG: hypothetical protein GVY19_01860, partial [Bacteroidetes bacterium]|nr:hypothetical protein [Bacteroidota bacterium]